MKEKKFFFDNNRLCGILVLPSGEEKTPLVILCHGHGSSKDSDTYVKFAETLAGKDIASFRFDFTGHGESDKSKEITITQAIKDLKAAIEFVNTFERVDKNRIGLSVTSFSGVVGLSVASENGQIKVLTLKSPVSRYAELERSKRRNAYYDDAKKYDGYEYAKKIKIPALVVHGDADESVPVEQSKKLVEDLEKGKLEIVKGADHVYSEKKHFNKMLSLISEWFVEKL